MHARKKAMLYKELMKKCHNETEAKYKKYKNKLVNVLHKAEKEYYPTVVNELKIQH